MPLTAAAISRELRSRANPASMAILQSFFKTGPGQYGEGDRFIGVKVPVIRAVCRECRGASQGEIQKLLRSPVHEECSGAAHARRRVLEPISIEPAAESIPRQAHVGAGSACGFEIDGRVANQERFGWSHARPRDEIEETRRVGLAAVRRISFRLNAEATVSRSSPRARCPSRVRPCRPCVTGVVSDDRGGPIAGAPITSLKSASISSRRACHQGRRRRVESMIRCDIPRG
jgi:DNA alkylation repair enzyme